MKVLKGLLILAIVAVVLYIAGVFALVWVVTPVGESFSGQVGPRVATQPGFVVKVIVDFPRHQDRGSGALIRNDMILTCYHNIRDRRGSETISIEFLDGFTATASVVKTDSTLDLALLRIKPVLYPCVKAALINPANKDTITICGFPMGGKYAEVMGELVGRRSHKSGGPSEIFLVNNKSISGMSGGPALDANRDLVGVLFGSNVYSNCTDIVAVRKFLESVR